MRARSDTENIYVDKRVTEVDDSHPESSQFIRRQQLYSVAPVEGYQHRVVLNFNWDVQPKDAPSIEDGGKHAEPHYEDSFEIYVSIAQLDLDQLLIASAVALLLQLREVLPATMADSTKSPPPSHNPSPRELHKLCSTPLA